MTPRKRQTPFAKKKPVVWTLEQGLKLLRALQPQVRAFNYHIAIGGGTVNKGHSLKDLDLYFLPLLNSTETTDTAGLLLFLEGQLGERTAIGPGVEITDNYEIQQDDHLFEGGKWKFLYKGKKRIDCFIAE
jgi:hypothetical protein